MADTEWQFGPTTSRPLWVLAHLPVAAFGGLFVAVAFGVLAAALLGGLGPRELLFGALLLLVGGPLSLLYLWPMLTDPDQRPRIEAFASGEMPYTPRSTALAAGIGTIAFAALLVADVPTAVLESLVFGSLAVVVLVALLSSRGRIEDGRLRSYGASAPLASINRVRSVDVGGLVLVWVSYVRGTGFFVPRLLSVPADRADAVVSALRNAETEASPVERDPVVTAVLLAAGGAFLAVAGATYVAIDGDAVVRIYLGGILAAVGALLCIAGWRGV